MCRVWNSGAFPQYGIGPMSHASSDVTLSCHIMGILGFLAGLHTDRLTIQQISQQLGVIAS